MKEWTIGSGDAGQRLDAYLRKAVPLLPASLLHKYIRCKRIKCNAKRTEAAYRLQAGDMLQLYINDEFFEKTRSREADFLSLTPDLRIVYEDEHVLLVDKVPGLVVHEDESGTPHTLINHIKAYLYQSGQWDPAQERAFVPALCNRIDRNTGGIVIAAKTAPALRLLNDKIKHRQMGKYYLCLVHGVPEPKQGALVHYVKRDLREKRVFVAKKSDPDAVIARLEYRVVQHRDTMSLVECRLLTGRTHQIRVQMAAHGHPLVGDTKYGTARDNRALPFSHQALYAYRLSFDFSAADGGCLAHLAGRSFSVEQVPFVTYFEKLPRF